MKPRSTASAPLSRCKSVLGKAVLPPPAFRPQIHPSAAQPAAARPDRRADVRPLRDAAARHRRGVPARRTKSTSPTGPTRAWCRSREGRFDLDDYIDYVIEMLHVLGPRHAHHRGVPAVGAGARPRSRVMEASRDPLRAAVDDPDGRPDRHPPQSDRGQRARRDSAASNGSAATSSPRCRSRIPASMRDVYPGFLQLNGFIAMNLDRHMDAHKELFANLVEGRRRSRSRSIASSMTNISR